MSAAGDWLTLRNALIKARNERGITQQSIARKLGMTRQAVSSWEKGVNFPPADALFAWAALVEVRIVAKTEPSEIERAISRCQVESRDNVGKEAA